MEKYMNRLKKELEEVLETDQNMAQECKWWIACHPIKQEKWLGAHNEKEMTR